MRDIKPKSLSSLLFFPLLLFIFIRPFFSDLAYPLFELYYENIVIFLAILTIFFSTSSFDRLRTCSKNIYTVPILILLASYIIAAMISVNNQNSIKETIKFISYLSMFLVVYHCDMRQKGIIVKTIIVAASIISIYSIYQYLWGYQHTIDYLKKINSDFIAISSYAKDILIAKRAIGTFPSPNLLGGYLIAAFFLSLSLVKNDISYWRIAPFLITAALILTKSMGAWLSLIAVLILLSILRYDSIKKKKIFLIIFLMATVIALTFILVSRWERLMDLGNPQNSITQRLNYWRTAIAVIKDHPLTGVGPGNFSEVFLNYKVGLSTDTRYAHNILLHQWAETGILGFIAIFYLIIAFLRRFKGAGVRNTFVLLAGLAFILHNLIDNTYFIPQAGLFFWILLALI